MLLRFRFSNFRSFRDEQELSLVAGPFGDMPEIVRHPTGIRDGVLPAAAIYGANASGKTNVILALHFMAKAVAFSHRNWEPEGPIPREPFLSAKDSGGEPSEIEADFLMADVRYRYGFRIDSEAVHDEWLYVYPRGKKQTWFMRQRGGPMTFSNKMPGENKTIENLTRRNSLFLSAAAQNNHEALLPVYNRLSGFLFVIGDRSPYRMRTLELCNSSDCRGKIARLVSIADLGITDLEVTEKRLTPEVTQLAEAIKSIFKLDAPTPPMKEFRLLHRFGDMAVPVPPGLESDGTTAYLALLGPVVDALDKGLPLLIDELDTSLHPLLAIEVIRLFNNPTSNPKGAQLIFNTHDTNLLSRGVLRRDQIWFTEKEKDGASHLFPLSDFKLRRQEDIQNGYLQGRYGAIPFINADSFLTQFEDDAKTGQA